jgi:drug/metabolite transporter (DMT)-like permease
MVHYLDDGRQYTVFVCNHPFSGSNHGLILFSLGAKYFPAAELNLLSLAEVVGGVIWVYLPIFGINEVPSMLTVVGGCIVTCAIILDSVGTGYKREVAKADRSN